MKNISLVIFGFLLTFTTLAEKPKKLALKLDPNQPVLTLDASCGSCNFNMKGKDCKLAVRYQKKPYYVQGTSINDHGDAHEDKGFCSVIRKAHVQGKLKGDKFVVTYFKLID